MFGWRTKKLLSIAIKFIVIWLIFCGAVTLTQLNQLSKSFVFGEFLNKWGENALFFLGYGNPLQAGTWAQNIVALVAILTISILTTYFTINFLWHVDDVVLVPAMFFEKTNDQSNPYKIHFIINNNGKRIANLRLSFTAYLQENNEHIKISESSEYTYPLLFKNSSWIIEDDLKSGFFQYVLYQQFKNYPDKLVIYMTLWFVDTQSGQECCNILDYNSSCLCEYQENVNYKNMKNNKIRRIIKIQKKDEHFKTEKENFIKHISNNFKPFDIKRLRLSPQNNMLKFAQNNKDIIEIDTDVAPEEKFPMFFYDYNNKPLDWSIYENDKINLVGKFRVSDDSKGINKLILEVKSGDGYDHVYVFYREEQFANKENMVCFNIDLKKLIKNSRNPRIKEIREINIVFPRETSTNKLSEVKGKVTIKKFGLEYQEK